MNKRKPNYKKYTVCQLVKSKSTLFPETSGLALGSFIENPKIIQNLKHCQFERSREPHLDYARCDSFR